MGLKDFFKKKVEQPKYDNPVVIPIVVEKPVEVVIERPVKKAPVEAAEKQVKKTKLSPKEKTDDLTSKCFKAIQKEVAKDFHEEAEEIIRLTTEANRIEFLKYHQENKGNICCMVLDKAKHDLIASGKLVHHDDDAFGKPFML